MTIECSVDVDVEQWLPVVGWEGYYEVSDCGRVRSVDRVVQYSDGRVGHRRGKVLSAGVDGWGYATLRLHRGGCGKTYRIHPLVLAAFVGPRPPNMEICHKNGDPSDNRVNNLRYGTRSSNRYDQQRHGTDYMENRTRCPWGHSLVQPNLKRWAFDDGRRSCLACDRAFSRATRVRRSGREFDFQAVSDEQYRKIMAGTLIPASVVTEFEQAHRGLVSVG